MFLNGLIANFGKRTFLILSMLISTSVMATDPPFSEDYVRDSVNNTLLVDFLKLRSLAAAPVIQCGEQDYPIFGVDIKIFNLGPEVNSPYSDYNPVLDKKETFMLYTSRRQVDEDEVKDVDGQYYEKMFVTRKEDGVFGNAHPITTDDSIFGRLPSTERHESLIFLSYSEDLLITYSNEKLYYSNRIGRFYTEPVEFPKVINKGKWKRHASITEDGRTLFFTTESKSTVNNNLNLDIWEIQRNNDGTWQKPKRLPDGINSPYNEDGPEISPDGRFLFFSSNRAGGIGGYDVYMAEKVNGKWQQPKNLCNPINTAGDDIYFKLSRNGNYAYYSSNALGGEGNMDIYKVVLDVPSIATCGSYAYGKRNITFTSPFSIEFYGKGTEFFWSFGDGQTEVGTEVNHEYAVDGDYNVVLYVRDKRSKRVVNTVFSKKVRVDTENSAVEITGPDTVEVGNEILFDGTGSYVDNIPATAYYWKVDGQLVSREPSINYEFTGVGKHKIELEVGVLDNRVMELSSSCIAREINVVTPFVYQQTVGANETSDGFSFTPLIPDRVLHQLGVEEKENALDLHNDYIETWEGEAKTFSAFENDRSPGISLEKVVLVSQAEHGDVKVVNAPYGQLEYKPKNGFSGYDKFTYSAKSKDGRVATATVVVSVMKRDEAMAGQNVTNDVYQLKSNESLTVFPLQNDQHTYGADQKLVSLTEPSSGKVQQIGLKGLIEYTPNASFQGSDAFTYTVEDEKGKKSTASVIIKATEKTSDDLHANPDFIEIIKDEKTRIKVLDNDVIKGSATIVDISMASHGSCKLINPKSGDVYYGPEVGYEGTDAFTYTLENSKGERSTTSVTVVVKPALNLSKPLAVETYQYNAINVFLFEELDIPSAYEIYGSPNAQHGTAEIVDSRKGILTYTPEGDFVGYDLFFLTLKRGKEEVQVGLVVKVLEQSGLISKYGVANKTMSINAKVQSMIDPFFEYNKLNRDARVLRVSGSGDVSRLSNGNKITFSYDKLDQEQFAITYQVQDDNGKLNAGAVLINPVDELGIPIVTRMVLTPDMAKTKLNKPVTVLPLLNDRHLKYDNMKVTSVSEPMNGTMVFNEQEGSVLYVPNLDFKGTDAFTYEVTDGKGVKATSVINIVVLSEVEYALENEGYNPKLKAFNYATLEPDKQFMNPEKVVDATGGMFGSVEVVNEYTGEIRYMPKKGFEGEDRFSFTMLHKDGSFTDHPVLAVVDERNDFHEGERIKQDKVEVFNDEVVFYYPLINKMHPQGKDMKIVSVKGEQGGVAGIINETAFSYRPLGDYEGLDKITYTILDDNGKLQTNEVYLDIKPKSDRHDLAPLNFETPVNIPLKISLKELARGYTYIDHSNPNAGSVKVLSRETLVFEYAASVESKDDQFTVSLKTTADKPAYVSINIDVLPALDSKIDRPSFADYKYKALDADEANVLAVAETDKGSLSFDKSTGEFTYEPFSMAKGYDRIEFVVEGDSGSATKRINVLHMDYERLDPDRDGYREIQTDDQNKLLIYAFSNIKDQDKAGIYINKIKNADEGSVKILDEKLGIIEYTPQEDVQQDEFSIQLRDDDKNKQEVTLTINLDKPSIPEKDETPMLSLSAAENLKNFNYQVIDYLDENNLKFLGVSNGEHGDIDMLDFSNGLFTYLPKDGFSGVDYILVEVEDESGMKFTIPVKVNVQKQEQISAQNLTYNNVSSVEAGRTSYHAVFGQNDENASLVTVESPKAGKVKILDASKGIVAYTPYKGFVGEDAYTFEYVTIDGDVYQKQMHVYVRDGSAGLISMGEIKRQSELVEERITNLTKDIADATEQSQADLPESERELAQARAAQKSQQQEKARENAQLEQRKQLMAQQEAEKRKSEEEAKAKAAEEARIAALEADQEEDAAQAQAAAEERRIAEQKAQAAKAEKEAQKAREEEAKRAELLAQQEEERKAKAQALAEDKRRAAEAQRKEVAETKDGETVVFRNILFDFDKSDLRPLSEAELSKVYNYMKNNPEKVLQLDGHADWIGTVEYNLALSERRAKRAYEFLRAKGISDQRLVYQYYGEAVPVAPNVNPDGTDNPDGRQLNRRCEFNIKSEGTADIIMKF